jgi:hypothetical protein
MEEARRLEVPVYALELGFLPRTLMLERHDVGFGSDLVSHPAFVSLIEQHEPDLARVEALRDYYLKENGAAPEAPSDASRGPVAAFLGSCPGYNLQPRESRSIRLASPWFGTFAQAFEAFRASLPRGAQVLARPHPADIEGLKYCRAASEPIQLACEGPISALVNRVDVVAVLGDTRTQYEAVLMGKPVALLSRSPLWGKGIAYEWDGVAPLRSLMAQAFERADWQSRRAAADRFMSFLARFCLYGYEDAPVDRGPEDLARFMNRFSIPAPGPSAHCDHARRLDRFVQRTAPLLCAYVHHELEMGARTLTEALYPYAEAQVVMKLLQSGTSQASIFGSGPAARRLAHALLDKSITVIAFLDDDGATSGCSLDGIPVRPLEWARYPGPTAIVMVKDQNPGPLASPPGAQWESASGSLSVAWSHTVNPGLWSDFASLARPGRARPEAVWMAMAFHYFDNKAWDDCRACVEQARNLRPAWSEPLHCTAMVARSLHAPAVEVLDLLTKALALEDPSPELFLDVGYAHFALQQWDQAQAYAREAAERRPEWSLPWHLQALCGLRQETEPALIAPLFEGALCRTPISPGLLFEAAIFAQRMGQLERAASLAGRAAEMSPSWADAQALAASLREQAP